MTPPPGRGDRGQSFQAGFIVLLGFVVVATALWQAQVVPAQNAGAEYRHNQNVKEQLQDVRGAVLSAPDRGGAAVTVSLGARYPQRDVFVNPGSPAGSLETAGTTESDVNLTIRNATATDAETADYWRAGANQTFATGALEYDPNYRVYTGYPVTVYENSVLYDQGQGANVTLAGQALISGERLELVVLNGSLSETRSGSYTVNVRTVSASTRTVSLTNTTGNLTLTFGSQLNASQWADLLEDETVANGGHVVDVRSSPIDGTDFFAVTVELEGDVTYDVRLAKVGVGSNVDGEPAHYVTDVSGDGSSMAAGSSQQLVVEVRDRLNNPVSGVTVRFDKTSASGTVTPESRTTDSEGRAVFSYTTTSAGTNTVTFNITAPAASDAATNVTFSVDVTGGSTTTDGAFDVAWSVPTQAGVTTGGGCGVDVCYDASDDGADDEIVLDTTTSPTAMEAAIEYDQENGTVGSFSTTSGVTGADGVHTVNYTATLNGTTELYTWSRNAGDALTLEVTGLGAGGGGNPPGIDEFTVTDNSFCAGTNNDVQYDVDWNVSDPDGDLDTVELTLEDSTGTQVDSVTNTVSGSSATGTDTLTDTGGCGTEYTITITVTDQAGNTASNSTTDVADGA